MSIKKIGVVKDVIIQKVTDIQSQLHKKKETFINVISSHAKIPLSEVLTSDIKHSLLYPTVTFKDLIIEMQSR